MIETLTLSCPIMIDGKEVRELTYDATEIDTDSYLEACSMSASIARGNNLAIKMAENDHSLHLCLGFMAIKAVNQHIDVNDLRRIKGYDVMMVANIGRVFIYGKSEETSEQSISEEPSGTTAEHFTPVPESLSE